MSGFFYVQFLMGEKFIRRGGSPIFSTNKEAPFGAFMFLYPSGEHLAKRFHDQRERLAQNLSNKTHQK
jgi:hypothetical protein